jgi:polar amino acid transport system ATP-binding protein
MSRAEIKIRNLTKRFGKLEVLKGVDFEVRKHEVVALIGPSGSGKSTLLRCLNFLEMPDEGNITWEGEPVDYRNMSPRALAAHRTRMGMVFQHFNLFPHRNALENVIEGPRFVTGAPRQEALKEGRRLLEQVGLGDKCATWPSQLSGGQQQRVAIARALAMKPQMLLLDEVTSALDVEMISGINDLLKDLARQGMTMVVVTHDLGFAREVANRICFLENGRILESGQPEQLLESPSNTRLKGFLDSCLSTAAAQA